MIALATPSLRLGCSFLVANYNLSAMHSTAQLTDINALQQRRGPDLTRVSQHNGWSFLHNLLSLTGAFTPQPFVANDVVALFNGELYNYRDLATELEGRNDAFISDGYALLPAYAKWGE